MKINLPEAKSGGIPEGIYKGRFLAVESVPPNLEKGYKAALKFTFEVSEGEHAGRKVSRICGIANGPKAELPKLLMGLMGKTPEPGGVDLAPYVGKAYILTVSEKRVENVTPLS